MGRSFLSVKLALAFGLCVSVLVLVADAAQAGAVDASPAVVEQPVTAPAEAAAAADVCLWRGCPLTWAPRAGSDGALGNTQRGGATGRLSEAKGRVERAT